MDYDSNGNVIHTMDLYGGESWSEYDENGNRIYRKNKVILNDHEVYYPETWTEYTYHSNGQIKTLAEYDLAE